ncbi:MAG TPA: hypothetical protein VJK51_00245 [Candidatus Nanoarchaeia archaeon]|nr:hypothetical protein [Candidatus Nanoarchaeia archaeon]
MDTASALSLISNENSITGEQFSITIRPELQEVYDVKCTLNNEEETFPLYLKNEASWKSSFYYIQNLQHSQIIEMKTNSTGILNLCCKLRVKTKVKEESCIPLLLTEKVVKKQPTHQVILHTRKYYLFQALIISFLLTTLFMVLYLILKIKVHLKTPHSKKPHGKNDGILRDRNSRKT